MRVTLKSKFSVDKQQQDKLPDALKIYEKADFAIQQKAKFIYYMIFAVLAALVFLLVTSAWLQLLRTGFKEISLPPLMPIIALLFLVIGCFILLIRGFFGLSTHILLVSAILSVWSVMWIDKSPFFVRLNTIVIILALLNLAPLFITKFKSTIIIYIISNIAILIGFMWFWGDKMNLPLSDILDYLIDTTVAIVFTGVVGYNIFVINKKTVDRAQVEINERKLTENALKESEESHRILIEALPDMIMQADLKGNILYGNGPFETITGITKKDYNNLSRAARIHPDDYQMVADAIKRFLLSNKSHSEVIDNRFIDAWGNIHWFSGRAARLVINNQIVLQTVTRDVTESKKDELELNNYRNHLESLVQERTDELATTNEELQCTNEELIEQREELQTSIDKLHEAQQQLIQSEKMASLGVLSSGIAHEINNPLNFIHGGITSLENYINENLPDHLLKVDYMLNAVNTGVKRASGIVTSLSHYSRRDDLPAIDCNIHEIIDNSLIMLQNKLKHKVEVKKKYAKENCVVFGNEGKLHQAFLNIISNAEQAIDATGTIEIGTKLNHHNVVITITDSGDGIKPENIQKIFDPFFTTKDPGKGTGLGMAITYNIIQEHQGTIEYESNVGLGTAVTISLPKHY